MGPIIISEYGRSPEAKAAEDELWRGEGKKKFSDMRRFQRYLSKCEYANAREYHLPDHDFGVTVREEVCGEMKVYTLNEQERPAQTVFYFHGGSYVMPPVLPQMVMVKKMIERTNCELRFVLYPKAPNYTAERTFELFEGYYSRFLSQRPSGKIVFWGDSAGGGLALAEAQILSAQEQVGPDLLLLMSPWIDVSMENPDITKYEALDPMLSAYGSREIGKIWAGGWGVKDPRVSPIFGDHRQLNEVVLFVGTREIFYPDVIRFDQLLDRAGVEHTLVIGKDMDHVFPAYPIPEADQALDIACHKIME